MGEGEEEVGTVTYRIVIQPTAFKALADIPDQRVQEKIRDRIDSLAHEPEQQGKPLKGELAGYRSLRAVGQRYRIIYRVERMKVLVLIVTLGLRKEGDKQDVYAVAKKLIHLRLI